METRKLRAPQQNLQFDLSNPVMLLLMLPFLPFYILAQLLQGMFQQREPAMKLLNIVRDQNGRIASIETLYEYG